jgi:hypothetical protein
MPNITVKIGTTESVHVTIAKATPMGALGTEAMVRVGQFLLTGSAAAMRAVADACTEAAELADAYDQDPDGYDQRERVGEL